jgi:periplasmic protein CpxP/Spy
MTDHETPAPQTSPPARRPCARRRAVTIAAVALALVLIGAYATTSFSQGFGGFGHGFGPGFGGPFAGGPVDPAWIEARLGRMIRHLAVELDATAEQQQKLQAIVTTAAKDVLPVREKMQAARQQARDLLTQTTVDRAALEKLRAEQIATADATSKRVLQAIADAAEVLTPDQRKKLAEMLPAGGRGPGWGWHGPGMMGRMGGFWGGGPRN